MVKIMEIFLMILKKKKKKEKEKISFYDGQKYSYMSKRTRCLIYFKTKQNELKNRSKLQRTIEVVAKLKLQITSYYN